MSSTTSTTRSAPHVRRSATSTGSAALNLLEDDSTRPEIGTPCVCSTTTTTTTGSTAVTDDDPMSPDKLAVMQVVRDSSYYISTLSAGVGSGMCSSIICAPLDLVRTRLQVGGNLLRQNGVTATSTMTPTIPTTPMQVIQQILNNEGPKGLFRGLGATMVTVPLFWGVYFPLYEETKHYMVTHYPQTNPVFIHCGSAVFTGAVADVLVNPLFVIRTRLQTQALHQPATIGIVEGSAQSTSAPTTMRHTALTLYQTHGLSVFWRGMSANLMGLSHVAIQFPTYEFLKSVARQQQQKKQDDEDAVEGALDLLLASGLAKMCASLISYPHEVLRSRMMDSRAAVAPTLMGTFTEIWNTEGPKGFYRGLPLTLFRVIPNCCITFLSYEYLKRWSQDHYQQWQRQRQQNHTLQQQKQSQNEAFR